MSVRLVLTLATITVAGVLTGCGHLGALREEASADFNCPEHQIHIMGHGRERTAEGCGQSGGYRWTGRSWVRDGVGTLPGSAVTNGPPPVNAAQPAPKGPQPVKVQPPQPAAPTGPNAPLPPSQPPPGQSL